MRVNEKQKKDGNVKKDKKVHALALHSFCACAIIDGSFLWMR